MPGVGLERAFDRFGLNMHRQDLVLIRDKVTPGNLLRVKGE
jgi:hypothetical protein